MVKLTDKKDGNRLQRMYESAIEAARLFVWTYNLRTHTVIMGDNPFTQLRCREIGLSAVVRNVPAVLKEYVSAESWPELCRCYEELEAGKPWTECCISLTLQGQREPLYLRISYTNIFDEQGNPVEAYGISRNITKEMTAYQQYKTSLTDFSASESAACIARGHHDLTGNRVMNYLRGKDGVVDFPVGMSYDQVVEGFLSTLRYAENRNHLRHTLNRQYLLEQYQQGKTKYAFEYYRVGGPRAISWVRMELNLLSNPLNGHIECFAAAFDSTYQHLHQQILRNLAQIGYYRIGLIDVPTNQTSFYDIDAKQRSIVAVSGIGSWDEHIAEKILPFVPEAEREAVRAGVHRQCVLPALEMGGSYQYAYNAAGADGALQRVLVQFYYLDDRRETIGTVQSNITSQYQEEQRQMKALQRALLERDKANEAKDDFLSSMSHDMRTPLNGILGFTHLALETADPVKKADYLQKIETSGQLLLSLINDVLDLSKIASGKIVLRSEPFDGHELMHAVLDVARQAAAEKQIRLTTDIRPEAFDWVVADRLRLQQVLLNLLSNAVKYTQEGGNVFFGVTPLPQEKTGYNVQFCIKDDGIGIAASFLPHIFEPFQQENPDLRQGTGLGLSIVERIVKLMHGKIEVVSEKGQGAMFLLKVLLPAAQHQRQTSLTEGEGSAGLSILRGKRILLCEDNELNAEIAEAILEKWGIRTELAVNGKLGVQCFADSGPGYYDAVLMDIQMPEMNGLEAAKTIRRMERSDARAVPIIAMTADAFRENIGRCLEAGMDAHLAKPVDVQEMGRVLVKFLAKGR